MIPIKLSKPGVEIRQKALFGFEENFIRTRAFDGGRDRERDGKDFEAFQGEIEVKVVAPFSVGDVTTFNEAVKFQGFPAIVAG